MQAHAVFLRLYVVSQDDRSVRAERNLRALLGERLTCHQCRLEVVDIAEHPELLDKDQVLAIPTLVRKSPQPERRVIGDLSEYENVIAGIGLQ